VRVFPPISSYRRLSVNILVGTGLEPCLGPPFSQTVFNQGRQPARQRVHEGDEGRRQIVG